MEDRTLLILASFTSLIGLVVLWFACISYDPPVVPLDQIDRGMLEKIVVVQGEISFIKEFNNFFLTRFENSSFKMYSYKKNTPEGLQIGDFITVTGEIKEYKGAFEIVPNRKGDVLIANRKI